MELRNAYIVTAVAAALVVVFAVLTQQRAQAWPRAECRTRDAAGAYGFLVEGQLLDDNELGLPAGPYAGTGRVELEYGGTWSAVTSYSIDGATAVDVPMAGSWSISSDCQVTLTQADFGVAKGTLVDEGNSINMISVNPGSAGTLRGVRIGHH